MSEEKIQPSRKERVGGAAIVLMAGNRTFGKKKNFCETGSRESRGGLAPANPRRRRPLPYKETLEEALWVAEGGPGSGGCHFVSNPN